MGNTKDTGFLRNLISYDASGNIVLPANLTVTGSLLTSSGATYATQSYVTTQISNLVNAAPGALDTLNELAAALGNDANFSTTVTNSIATKLALSGGTLTGALVGTSAAFTSAGNLGTQLHLSGTSDSAGIRFTPVTGEVWEIQANTSNQWFVYNRTDSAYRLVISGSGEVGIGTTSPNKALEILSISDQLRLSYNASTYTDLRSDSAGGLLIKAGGNYIIQYINGSEKTRLTSDGYFGIGTGSPVRTLHTMGQAAFDMSTAGIVIQDSSGVAQIVSYKQTGSTYSDLHLRGANLGIVINGTNGNVGIGATTISNHRLQINGSVANVFLQSSADGSAIDYGSYGISSSYPQVRLTMVDDGNWGGHFFISTKPAGASTNALIERVRVTSGGNMGVGVTSPSWKLSVANEAVIGAQGGSDYTYISGGSGYGSVIRNYYATGTINNEFRGNGNNYVNLGYGSFGIGTSNPLAKLHVSGGKIIHTSDDGGYGQFQINASTTSTEATILLSNGGSGVNNGQYTNVGVIGMGGYGAGRDTLVLGTGYSGWTMGMKNGTTTFTGNVVNSASYKAHTYIQLTTPIVYNVSVSGNVLTSFSTTGLGLPSGCKALQVLGWYHITGYSSGAGQGDHATSIFGITTENSIYPWSGAGAPYPGNNNTLQPSNYGSFILWHDGDASNSGNSNGLQYYGLMDSGIVTVNSNGNVYCNLAAGYSGGTHYIVLWIQGYWI